MDWFTGLDKEIQKLLIITLISIIGAIFLFVALRMGWLKNFKLSAKEGVQFDTRDSESQNKLNAYNMAKAIGDIDMDLKFKYRRLIADIRLKLINGLYGFGTCDLAKVAVSSAFYFPLMAAVEENHFRRKFVQSRVDGYIDTLIQEIEIDYNGFCAMASNACENAKVPPFSEVSALVRKLLKEQWARKIIDLMICASEEKMTVYDSYIPQFTSTGDKYNLNVCNECKEKNKRYMEELRHV